MPGRGPHREKIKKRAAEGGGKVVFIMEWSAKWIAPAQEMGDVCPVYEKAFPAEGKIAKALTASAAIPPFFRGFPPRIQSMLRLASSFKTF